MPYNYFNVNHIKKFAIYYGLSLLMQILGILIFMSYHSGKIGEITNIIFVVLFSKLNLIIQLFSFNFNSVLSVIYFMICGVFYLNIDKINKFVKIIFCVMIAFLDFYVLVLSNWT